MLPYKILEKLLIESDVEVHANAEHYNYNTRSAINFSEWMIAQLHRKISNDLNYCYLL